MLSFTACSNKVDSYYVDSEDNTPLMIYIYDWDEDTKHHINAYNALHDETQIEYEAFDYNSAKLMHNRIKKEISEFRGPDLIFINPIMLINNDINKMTKEGMFADMDKLIAKSQLFDESLYNMKAIDAGIIDDTRVIIPVAFRHEMIIAIKKNFDDIGLDLPQELTIDTLYDLLNRYYNSVPKDSVPLDNICLELSLLTNINESNQITHLEGLDEIFEMEEENAYRKAISGLHNEYNKEGFDWYQWHLDHDILFEQRSIGFADLYYTYNLLKNKYDSDIALYNYPISFEKTILTPYTSFAINAASEKKNKAFKFIEYMLSEEVQSGDMFSWVIPVNLDSYDEAKIKLINGEYDIQDGDFTHTPVPAELVYQLIDMIEDADYEINSNRFIYFECFSQPLYNYSSHSQLDSLIDKINKNLYKHYNPDNPEEEE
jgi:ABC-type glycerol-3-phosphate transport system substrate-binding protein